jgi:hypothetical protein
MIIFILYFQKLLDDGLVRVVNNVGIFYVITNCKTDLLPSLMLPSPFSDTVFTNATRQRSLFDAMILVQRLLVVMGVITSSSAARSSLVALPPRQTK